MYCLVEEKEPCLNIRMVNVSLELLRHPVSRNVLCSQVTVGAVEAKLGLGWSKESSGETDATSIPLPGELPSILQSEPNSAQRKRTVFREIATVIDDYSLGSFRHSLLSCPRRYCVHDMSTYKYRKENSIFGSVTRTFMEREF